MATAEDLVKNIRAKYSGIYDDMSDSSILLGLMQNYPGAYDDLIKPKLGFVDEPTRYPSAQELTEGAKVYGEQFIDASKLAGEKSLALAEDIAQKPIVQGTVKDIAENLPILAGVSAKQAAGINEAISRGLGGMRATVAGRSPFEGIAYPEEQPSYGKSIARALRIYGVKDEKIIGRVSKNLGPVVDQAAALLALGVVPQAISESYWSSLPVRKFILRALEDAKLSGKLAGSIEKALKAGALEPKSKFVGKTPQWLKEEYLKSNLRTKGTPFIEADLQNQSVRDAISSDPTLSIEMKNKLLAPRPNVAPMTNVAAPPTAIGISPITPLAAVADTQAVAPQPTSEVLTVAQRHQRIKERVEALAAQKKLVTGKPTPDPVVVIPEFKSTNEAIAFGIKHADNQTVVDNLKALRESLAAPITEAQAKGDFQTGLDLAVKAQFYREAREAAQNALHPKVEQVSDDTLVKMHETAKVSLESIQYPEFTLEQQLKLNAQRARRLRGETVTEEVTLKVNNAKVEAAKESLDVINKEISKRTSGLGEEGFTQFPAFIQLRDKILDVWDDIKNLYGDFIANMRYAGLPSFVAKKHPTTFEPIYRGVDKGHDMIGEYHAQITKDFDPAFIRKLVLNEERYRKKSALTRVLEMEDLTGKEFEPAALASRKLSDEERVAYAMIRKSYKEEIPIYIQSLKDRARYNEMAPEQKELFDKMMVELKGRQGYLNTQRFDGSWVVARKDPGFFQTTNSKTEAMKLAAEVGGKAFKRNQLTYEAAADVPFEALTRLMQDIEIDPLTADKIIKAYIDKGIPGKWTHKRGVEGYDYTLKNILKSAMDSFERTAQGAGRARGRMLAEQAYNEKAAQMPKLLQVYSRNFIDGYYNLNAKGYRTFMKIAYASTMALRPIYLIQDLLVPLQTTWGAIGKHLNNNKIKIEGTFNKSYLDTMKWIGHEVSGKDSELPYQLQGLLSLYKERRLLGQNYNEFILGAKGMTDKMFDNTLTMFNRGGEHIKRVHSVIAAYWMGVEKYGLKTMSDLDHFVKSFLEETHPTLVRHDTPVALNQVGILGNAARTAAMFTKYPLFYMHYMARQVRSGNPDQYLRAIVSLLLTSGIFVGQKNVTDYLYSRVSGGITAEAAMRKWMAAVKLSPKLMDIIIQGAPAVLGADLSQRMGYSTILDITKDAAHNIGRYPLSLLERLQQAMELASSGQWDKAAERVPLGILSDLARANNLHKYGVRTPQDKKILDASINDILMAMLGIQSSRISRARAEEKARSTYVGAQNRMITEYSDAYARALYINNNPREAERIRDEYHRRGIKITAENRRAARDRVLGRTKTKFPQKYKRELREQRRAFRQ